jgi:hypothetical protein
LRFKFYLGLTAARKERLNLVRGDSDFHAPENRFPARTGFSQKRSEGAKRGE